MAETKTDGSYLTFRKMHGIGNDFVVFDAVTGTAPPHNRESIAKAICDRRFGVGADGTIYIERAPTGGFRMRMFNPDGSESEMCGNGVRCVAAYLQEIGLSNNGPIPIETGAGLLTLEILGSGLVRVDMGPARLKRADFGMDGPPESTFILQEIEGDGFKFTATAVSMGNPHLVIVVPNAAKINLARLGPVLENYPLFPDRVNVHFVQVIDRQHIIQRTWERGAGATLACGTGACACVVATSLAGLTDRLVDVSLPGGGLTIDYKEVGRVFMTGTTETVFEGTWKLD